jgi:hypothetical protein
MGISRGFRLSALFVIGVLIPQISLPQIGAPRIEIQPLAVPVRIAAKRILASVIPAGPVRPDFALIADRITPAWAMNSPVAYSPNESYMSNFTIVAPERALFDQGDIMSQRKLLELKQQYTDMNRDFDQRTTYGLADPDTTRFQYDRMRNFSRDVFTQMRTFQSSVYRDKLNAAAERDPNLRSTPVRVVGGISAIYFNSPVMIALSEETRISARTSLPDQTGQVAFTSPVINGTLDMDGHAEDALIPGTVPTDPTWTREKYRLSVNRPLGIFGITSAASYGSTTTQVSASVSKPISDHVTCVVDTVKPLNAPGAVPEERVKVLYGLSF